MYEIKSDLEPLSNEPSEGNFYCKIKKTGAENKQIYDEANCKSCQRYKMGKVHNCKCMKSN